ncbi:MAG: hypothetical protein Q4D93_02870 [Porphyromonas sp.]|nr:hypothetical protein [Porphyromonas sp.]
MSDLAISASHVTPDISSFMPDMQRSDTFHCHHAFGNHLALLFM